MKIQIASLSKVEKRELSAIENDRTFRCGVEYEFLLNDLYSLDVIKNEAQEEIDLYKKELEKHALETAQEKENWYRKYIHSIKTEIQLIRNLTKPHQLKLFNREDFGLLNEVADYLEENRLDFTSRDACAEELHDLSIEEFYGNYGYPEDLKIKPKRAGIAFKRIQKIFDLIIPEVPTSSEKLNSIFGSSVEEDIYSYIERVDLYDEKTYPSFDLVLDYFKNEEENGSLEDYNGEIDQVAAYEAYDWSDFPFTDPLISDYHAYQGSISSWRVETDDSLGESGVEVISPPLNLKETFASMQEMFTAIKEHGETDNKCGLHVNLSFDSSKMVNVNLAKLALFMDEGYIDRFFEERSSSSYVEYLDKWISNAVQNSNSVGEIETLLIKKFPYEKYSGINISNLDNGEGRIEFRYLGGSDYEDKYDEIKQQILKFGYYLKISCDDSYKKKEYLLKLFRLRNRIPAPFDKDLIVKNTVGYTFYKVAGKIIRVPNTNPVLRDTGGFIEIDYVKAGKLLTKEFNYWPGKPKKVKRDVILFARTLDNHQKNYIEKTFVNLLKEY